MAASQPFGISCKGGLNTNLNQLEMLAQPGLATKLLNFEVDPDGGYRRINGYTPFGGASATRPTGASDPIFGVHTYGDGVVVCAGTGIYFSQDGVSWLQVNRFSATNGDTYAIFTAQALVPRTNQKQSSFAVFSNSYDYGELLIADGANEIFSFRMEGTGPLNTRTFHTKKVSVLSGTHAVKEITIHDHHLIAAGVADSESTLYYSANLDPDTFTGPGAGAIAISDVIVGIRSFRNDLFIFGRNSLHKLININDSATIQIVPVAKNIGCLNGQSIQEIGGDLVFLAPDGIRSVAGTSRIGDVELGSVSRQIQAVLADLASSINTYIISSVVLRSKSQYRLFYTVAGESPSLTKGIIGTLTPNGFEWSQTQGIQATAVNAYFNKDGIEKEYHGDYFGYVYNHDTGNSFYSNGQPFNIAAQYVTPNYDFGDIGTRKTLQYAKISITPEGEVQPTLRVRYDYEDTDIPQPPDYILDAVPLPALFGSAVFGVAIFGASNDPMLRQAIQGSGHACSFRISSTDQKAPYAINGIYINYVPAGRR